MKQCGAGVVEYCIILPCYAAPVHIMGSTYHTYHKVPPSFACHVIIHFSFIPFPHSCLDNSYRLHVLSPSPQKVHKGMQGIEKCMGSAYILL